MTYDSSQIVVSSRVRLARNYHDLPFSNLKRPENALLCVQRAQKALDGGVNEEQFSLFRLQDMNKLDQMSLVEQHLVSRDLLEHSEVGAALIRDDRHVSVMINEEDHLRIQAMLDGLSLAEAAKLAFAAEEKLATVCDFSFDNQLGYLTACPTNTGTGMRASLMLHLPMLTRCKQMGNVTQSVAKLGLTIRGIYGEGSEALGDLYQVSNQVTLGRTEQELIGAVTAVGHQLTDMELALRDKALKSSRVSLEDSVFRAWGLMKYARVMSLNEYFKHWSGVRLGAALGMLPVTLERMDTMLDQAQDAHLRAFAESPLEGAALDEYRAARLRTLLEPA